MLLFKKTKSTLKTDKEDIMIWFLISYLTVTLVVFIYFGRGKEEPYEGWDEKIFFPIVILIISLMWPLIILIKTNRFVL